ncbi:hypothetical protein ACYULU_16640, partial [Breznakiellaceae bacterium SP9]
MAENYMKQYIELSNEFRKNNKSQEIIGKLYDFIDVLEKDDHKENKMVLTYVYTLMGFHKKAYDLYVTIYNQNDRKQKAKLFDMEQMSKSHGDNFIVKLHKKQKAPEKTNYTADDFVEEEHEEKLKTYTLNKDCVIFNQTFASKPLRISIHKDIELLNYISPINEYINWLGGNCKKELIKYYNKNISPIKIVSRQEIIALDWGLTLKTAVPVRPEIKEVGIRAHD